MTKLNENFKYERLLEQAGVINVSSCYRDHANPVQCKRDDRLKPTSKLHDRCHGSHAVWVS